MKTFLLIFLLSALTANADPSGSETQISPDSTFFAATRRTPDDEIIWKTDVDDTRLVIFTLKPKKDGIGRPIKGSEEMGSLYARHEIGGRLVAKMSWSPNSKFLVITTTSSGGHSPYHYKTFVFCVADKSLRYMDDVTDAVLDPDFHFEPPDVAVMTVHDRAHELFEPGDRRTIKVPLHEVVKKMKKT